MAEVIGQAWAFAVGIDVSTDDFGRSHLDERVRFPGIDNGYNLLSFHLLAIPLFTESYSGELLFNIFVMVLDVLCPQWKHKIIGLSAYGSPNMTVCHSGYTKRLANVALGQAFY